MGVTRSSTLRFISITGMLISEKRARSHTVILVFLETLESGRDYILELWWTDVLLINTNMRPILHLPPSGPHRATRKTPLSTPRSVAINTPLDVCVRVCVEGEMSQKLINLFPQ